MLTYFVDVASVTAKVVVEVLCRLQNKKVRWRKGGFVDRRGMWMRISCLMRMVR